MPKTLTAQSVESVNPVAFVWKESELVQILVQCEVNFGQEGRTYQYDILPDLNDQQKERAKEMYQFIHQKAVAHFVE